MFNKERMDDDDDTSSSSSSSRRCSKKQKLSEYPLNEACREDDFDTVQLILQLKSVPSSSVEVETTVATTTSGGQDDDGVVVGSVGNRDDSRKFLSRMVNMIDSQTGLTPLMEACRIDYQRNPWKDKTNNNPNYVDTRVSIVQLLLDMGANVNKLSENQDGRSALGYHVQSHTFDLNLVQLLIDHGANVNLKDRENGQTPIYSVVTLRYYEIDDNGNTTAQQQQLQEQKREQVVELLRRLLLHGTELTITDHKGRTPIHQMVGNRYSLLHVLFRIIEEVEVENHQPNDGNVPIGSRRRRYSKDDILNLRNSRGDTPLHEACYLLKRSVAFMLILHGANVNAVNHQQLTPLHMVIQSNDLSDPTSLSIFRDQLRGERQHIIEEILLPNGAQWNGTTSPTTIWCTANAASTPIELAIQWKETKIVQLLLERAAAAAAASDTTTVTEMLNQSNPKNGDTLLHYACSVVNLRMVQFLVLQHNVTVHVLNNEQWTPLCKAINNNHEDVPAHKLQATINDQEAIVRLLLENGAQVNDDRASWSLVPTPLPIAIQRDHYVISRLLLQQGANKHVPSMYFHMYTPLHLACGINDLRLAQLLVEGQSYADRYFVQNPSLTTTSRTRRSSKTTMETATAHQQREYNHPIQRRQLRLRPTPLSIAIKNGAKDIICLLLKHGYY